ncbi:MAG: methyltransferase domain-containing protein [Candidatus Micrarchaeota archaeon]
MSGLRFAAGALAANGGGGGSGSDSDATTTVLPYDPVDLKTPILLTSISDIEAFDRELALVTKGLPLLIDIGSVLRVTSSRYAEFGIGLTDDNRAELETKARHIYINDAAQDRSSKTPTDTWYKFKKNLADPILTDMAMAISVILTEILSTVKKDGPVRILDIATGSGRLVSAVITALASDTRTADLVKRIELHMVDYSSNLSCAQNNAIRLGVSTVRTHSLYDEQYLDEAHVRGDKFDIVMTLSHLHRKPFIDGYLRLLKNVLEPDGIIASGDFHSTMTHHPSHLYTLLERHGVEPVRMNLLRELFGPLLTPKPCHLTACEDEAIQDHLRYWDKLLRQAVRFSGGARVRILGGFLSSIQLCSALDRIGMSTNKDALERAFPNAKLPNHLPHKVRPNTDTGVVTIARVRS